MGNLIRIGNGEFVFIKGQEHINDGHTPFEIIHVNGDGSFYLRGIPVRAKFKDIDHEKTLEFQQQKTIPVRLNTVEMLTEWAQKGCSDTYICVDSTNDDIIGKKHTEFPEIKEALTTYWTILQEEQPKEMTFEEAMQLMDKEHCQCYNNYDTGVYELMSTGGNRNEKYLVRTDGRLVEKAKVTIGMVSCNWYRK